MKPKKLRDEKRVYSVRGEARFPYRLQVFERQGGSAGRQRLVVISDLSSSGTGVAAVIERVATEIATESGRRTRGATPIIIEHYPERPHEFEETYARVEFQQVAPHFSGPRWRYIERREVEGLIGATL